METVDLFIKSLQSFITEKNKQGNLADTLNISRPHFNSFLKGKRKFSEAKKEMISAYFGKTYLEMLNLGKELYEKEGMDFSQDKTINEVQPNDLSEYQDKQHAEVIKNFKQKQLAKECNMIMVELEELNPTELQDLKDFLEFRLEKQKKIARKKAAKKKAKGM